MEKTHNLEVVGSSPTWSTLKIKHLQRFVGAFLLFANNLRTKLHSMNTNINFLQTQPH